MTITEVRIKLPDAWDSPRLLAYCTITLDGCFVVHDVRLLTGEHGLVLAMPSRKQSDRCLVCSGKNALTYRYCCQCGERLADNRLEGIPQLHHDVAHPITPEFRSELLVTVLSAVESARRAELALQGRIAP